MKVHEHVRMRDILQCLNYEYSSIDTFKTETGQGSFIAND